MKISLMELVVLVASLTAVAVITLSYLFGSHPKKNNNQTPRQNPTPVPEKISEQGLYPMNNQTSGLIVLENKTTFGD